MRKLASIQKVEWINPIEGKDRIELVGVLGWQVICRKGEYNIGDLTVFCEIDSVLPEKEEFEFLRKSNFRIKTMKMSGVLSQGICFPLSILSKGNYIVDQDVTELMGIKQYEKTMDKEFNTENTCESNRFKHPFFTRFLFKFKIFRNLLLPKKQNKGFPDFISKTDEVRCLNCDTKIETNIGKLRISDIVNKKLKVLVKSYNKKNDTIEFKSITNYQKILEKENWVQIKYKMHKYGNRENTIKCTYDHKFFTNNGYIESIKLKENDIIYNIENCYNNNDIKHIFGIILGDSHVSIDKRLHKDGKQGKEIRLQLTQGEAQLEYLKEKIRLLDGDINKIRKQKSGYCENFIYQYTTNVDYNLSNTLYDMGCIVNNKFIVNQKFCDSLTPQALAFWYLDDGTLSYRDCKTQSPSIRISTNSENTEEINLLINMLIERFNIKCNYRKDRSYGSIYITTDGTEKFLKLITPYIPISMRHKTIPKFENSPYEFENKVFKKKDMLLENKIIDLKIIKNKNILNRIYSYDIEVEDNHNFFANNILTHNCQNAPFYLNLDCNYIATEKLDGQSGSFSLQRIKGKHFWQKDKFDYSVCSRNLRLWNKNNSSYWKVSDKYNIEQVLYNLIGDNEWVSIQGECLDTNVQGNKYKVKETDLYVFNLIYPNGRINSIEAKEIVERQGMKFVPIIDESINLKGMSVNEVLDYATDKSKLYDILREGIVFRSLDGKQSFKAVSPDFLIKNNE